MSDSRHVVCPHCAAVNRSPESRLQEASCGVCHQPLFVSAVTELTADTLAKHIQRNDIPLVVDFWAPWCAPCRMMAPAYAEAAANFEPRLRLAKLNTEAYPDAGARFAIRSIPSLVVFSGGQEIARQAGAIMGPQLSSWLNQFTVK